MFLFQHYSPDAIYLLLYGPIFINNNLWNVFAPFYYHQSYLNIVKTQPIKIHDFFLFEKTQQCLFTCLHNGLTW